MLGTLAKWLRIFGFDTYYANTEISDEELLLIAKKENRTIVTRDKMLIRRGRRENLKVTEIDSTDIDEQLRHVLEDIEINEDIILSRCIICNTNIKEISKNKVEGKIPENVFKNNEKFWFCPRCDKIYWTGTHTDKMIKKIKKIRAARKHLDL
jgi:hypothetical protein